MFWLKFVNKFIKLLKSNISPGQIAGGFSLGALIGLTPFFTLHNIFFIFLILILNVNISSAFLSIAIFKILGHFTDPVAHFIGKQLLINAKFLNSFWTTLYNAPIVPFTKFYNTVVLGNFIIWCFICFPVFYFLKKFIIYYRLNLSDKIDKFKIVKILKFSKIYDFYDRFK